MTDVSTTCVVVIFRLWRWLPHRLSKLQSLSTTIVLFRTTFSPIQDYVHPDDQSQPTFEMTPGLKPFTKTVRFSNNFFKNWLLCLLLCPCSFINSSSKHDRIKKGNRIYIANASLRSADCIGEFLQFWLSAPFPTVIASSVWWTLRIKVEPSSLSLKNEAIP